MSLANVGSKWVNGVLIFFAKATGTTIFSLNSTGDVELGTGQHVKGERFVVSICNFAAASIGIPFFIAPAACKLVSAYERHITVCDAADTMTIEKLTTGEAPGAGDVALAATFTLNSAANTPVTKVAVADGKEIMAAGDALCTKFAAGDGTNYAGANLTVTLEWL
jgi:hypothetical protein